MYNSVASGCKRCGSPMARPRNRSRAIEISEKRAPHRDCDSHDAGAVVRVLVRPEPDRRPAGDSPAASPCPACAVRRSEEHTSELQSLMRHSYAVFCLTKKKQKKLKSRTSKQKKNHKKKQLTMRML